MYFDESDRWTLDQINNVWWNYGTDQNPVQVPSPGGASLGILGLSVVTLLKRRRT